MVFFYFICWFTTIGLGYALLVTVDGSIGPDDIILAKILNELAETWDIYELK